MLGEGTSVHCGELAICPLPCGSSVLCATPSGKNLACKQTALVSARSIFRWLRPDEYEWIVSYMLLWISSLTAYNILTKMQANIQKSVIDIGEVLFDAK